MPRPTPPQKPAGYIEAGVDWTAAVSVPGLGVWDHDPRQVGLDYRVYKQDGRDYHVTINSAFAAQLRSGENPGDTANAHITSDADPELVGGPVHWSPNDIRPPHLSAQQRAWVNTHLVAMTKLLAEFQAEFRRGPEYARRSHEYRLAHARWERDIEAYLETHRAAGEAYEKALAAWVETLGAGDYHVAFRVRDDWCVLDEDRDRGTVVPLRPMPQIIWQADKLNSGFVDLCQKIVDIEVSSTDLPKRFEVLHDVLMLISIGDKRTKYAMRRSEFLGIRPAGNVLSWDDVLARAIEGWAREAVFATRRASDGAVMNLALPDGGQCRVKVSECFDIGRLRKVGRDEALRLAAGIDTMSGVRGVYPLSAAQELREKLPRVVRIADAYALASALVEGWAEIDGGAEAAEAAEARMAAAPSDEQYARAWAIIRSRLSSSTPLDLPIGHVGVAGYEAMEPDGEIHQKASAGHGVVDTLRITRYDKPLSNGDKYRFLYIQYNTPESLGYAVGLATYIQKEAPDLPADIKRYVVTASTQAPTKTGSSS